MISSSRFFNNEFCPAGAMVARQTSIAKSGGCGFESHVGCHYFSMSCKILFCSHGIIDVLTELIAKGPYFIVRLITKSNRRSTNVKAQILKHVMNVELTFTNRTHVSMIFEPITYCIRLFENAFYYRESNG